MGTVPAAALFLVGAATILGAGALLVSRIERVAKHIGLAEALLGLVAALAADGPEITSSITAVANGHRDVGIGVALGSNVFNLAALLGLAAVVAGRIRMHRRVVMLDGGVGAFVAVVALGYVVGLLGPVAALAIVFVVVAPYIVVSASPHRTLSAVRAPVRARRWLEIAISEEEAEIAASIAPRDDPGRRSGAADAVVALAALAVVVAASISMEESATTLGTRWHVPGTVVGGLVLAAVTSLPNAAAAVFLAARGRGQAVLSVAMNSNTLNVLVGLLLPAAIFGLPGGSSRSVMVAAWSAGLTLAVLAAAWRAGHLSRQTGILVILGYLLFATILVLC